jgi:hypothetical protein
MNHRSSQKDADAAGSDEFMVVFTTGKLLQFDMAVDVLKQARIPFQTREETGTGIKLATPVAPTPGPGVFWSVLVPWIAVSDARQALSELPFPITTSSGPWDFLPSSTSEQARADARAQRWIISIVFLSMSIWVIATGIGELVIGRHPGDAIESIAGGAVFLAAVVALIRHSRRWLRRHPETSGSHQKGSRE